MSKDPDTSGFPVTTISPGVSGLKSPFAKTVTITDIYGPLNDASRPLRHDIPASEATDDDFEQLLLLYATDARGDQIEITVPITAATPIFTTGQEVTLKLQYTGHDGNAGNVIKEYVYVDEPSANP